MSLIKPQESSQDTIDQTPNDIKEPVEIDQLSNDITEDVESGQPSNDSTSTEDVVTDQSSNDITEDVETGQLPYDIINPVEIGQHSNDITEDVKKGQYLYDITEDVETGLLSCDITEAIDIDQHLNENPKATVVPKDEKFDIDLEDPEVQIAAQKIQAGFRNLMKKKKSDNWSTSWGKLSKHDLTDRIVICLKNDLF